MEKNTEQKIKRKKKIQFSKITQNIKSKKKGSNDGVAPKKKKKRLKHTLNFFLIIFMIIMIVGALSCLSFCVYIIVKSPEFEVEKLYRSASTTILDINGDVIAELGVEKRENVTYDQLPEIVVDAVVATEDSRFFQHAGIDLLRFGKASLGQLLGQSGAGGGSTLTMQIAKNSYSVDKNGKIADRGIAGIIRKFTDIYMAVFKIEKTYSKQEIFEFYVNQANFGNGAYGIQQAAQTYFKKDVGELNLPEAALLVGLFQAPSAYDPYLYPETAQARRNQVINLMMHHGYITADEAAIAKSINVKDMLSGYNYSYSQYQGFLDTLVADVLKKTGKDPASVSMTIYTTLDPSQQKVINQLYDGTLYKWKDNVVQCALAVTDVKTGAIVAVGAGRNKTGERQWNLATDIRRHPGSTIKPILDYGPAIEYEGWGTGQFIIDDAYTYSNGTGINNVDKGYKGIMTIKRALAGSRNIPALQAFQATSQSDKYEFATNLGIQIPLNNDKQIFESASIGAFDGVSPLQLSAAYATFARGGYYIEPYTFTKIEFNDTGETYNHTPSRSKAMSEETAYMINDILHYAVTSGNVSIGGASVSGTDIASKTGTTSYDNSTIQSLKIPYNSIRDSWQVVYSPDYSLAFWYGYNTPSKQYYMTDSHGWAARREIARVLTPRLLKKNSRFSKPSGITSVTIELETNPVQLASEGTPSNLRSTEYYKKGTEPTEVSNRFQTLDNVKNLTYSTVGSQVHLSWSDIDTPEAMDDTYLQNYFQEGYGRWAQKYYERRLSYNQNNMGEIVYEVFMKDSSGNLTSLGTTNTNSFTTTISNSTTFVIKSTYSIYKGCASSGKEISVTISPSIIPPSPGTDTDDDDDQSQSDPTLPTPEE